MRMVGSRTIESMMAVADEMFFWSIDGWHSEIHKKEYVEWKCVPHQHCSNHHHILHHYLTSIPCPNSQTFSNCVMFTALLARSVVCYSLQIIRLVMCSLVEKL